VYFNELAYFIKKIMRMSHIYQPVMIKALIENGGKCHEDDLAKSFLAHDISQVEYYRTITNNMVGKVLRNHGIVKRDLSTKEFSLEDFESFNLEERQHLIALCEEKLQEFLDKRGQKIFQHRRRSSGYISGTLKYEVLKRARYRCELCGISADIKALEVDHIIPRNFEGSDDISNLQALCYSCNAMKRDRDDTDFRGIIQSYKDRDENCIFCNLEVDRVVEENELAFVILDGYPVTDLHTLVIPKRHVESYFNLGQAEINAVNQLIQLSKERILKKDESVAGFNIGINDGEVAGQTLFHCHVHLIPRRAGDVGNPLGGVRHVISEKGFY
jgi:ATP adenylyltransferase